MESYTLYFIIDNSSTKIPPSNQTIFHNKALLTALHYFISVKTTFKVIPFPCLALMRIKFFGSFHHLVADVSEMEAVTIFQL
jgi:hypothetical protein